MKRKLKVEDACRVDRRSNYSTRETRIPQVRLKGKWLEAAGFRRGTSLQLTVCSPGVIELRVIESPEDRAARLGAEFLATGERLDKAIARAKGGVK